MINGLDFKSIKRAVKLESVLRHYHVELRRSGKDQYRGCCPIHRGDGSDAFHVNLARNVFHCFACGAGGTVLDFVAAMEGCSLFDAAQRLQSMKCTSAPLTLTPNGKELVTERRKVSSPLKFKLTGIDCAHPYLAGERPSRSLRSIQKRCRSTPGCGHSYPRSIFRNATPCPSQRTPAWDHANPQTSALGYFFARPC
jgi:hypothetical protein